MSLKLSNRLKKHFRHEKQLNRPQAYSSVLGILIRAPYFFSQIKENLMMMMIH